MGSRNVFREFSTVQRGTASGHGETVIGDDNYFMNYTHVGHDNRIGSRVVMANSAVLAGHVEVGNHAIIGAFNAIHQFCRVGAYAFLGAYTGCRQDVLPFCRTDGLDARRPTDQHDRPEAQRLLRRADRGAPEGLPAPGQVEAQHEPGARADRGGAAGQPDVEELVRFIKTSERGFIK